MVLERGRENLCPHTRFHVLRAVEPGDTLLDLVAGSSGTGFLGVYARLAGADEVYQVRGALGAHMGRDEASWRDRRIAAVPADGVDRIGIRLAGERAHPAGGGPPRHYAVSHLI